jgi:hypothetical protein
MCSTLTIAPIVLVHPLCGSQHTSSTRCQQICDPQGSVSHSKRWESSGMAAVETGTPTWW